MFTGLVETTGSIVRRTSSGGAGKLVVLPETPFADPVFGESVAVNGCCLTLEKSDLNGQLTFHTLSETLDRTNLGELPMGARVNMERAMKLGARVGGHLVSGHIDAAARLLAVARRNADVELQIELPEELAPYLVEKGSIAIDGVSLTLVEVAARHFSVCLIPVTLADTALLKRRPGDRVNLETDLLGKYVVRQLELARSQKSTVTMDTLREAGFL